MDNRPIGLLDSGVGGLTVVKKIIAQMPNEATVFIGDNAHIPYGDKTKDEITELTRQSVEFLLSKNVKLIIFACNTATKVALDVIQNETNTKLIGVIKSGSIAAIRATKNKHIAVVGTQMTATSHAYKKEITALDPAIEVTELAAPKLVPLIENNATPADILPVLTETLEPLQKKSFDTLILGCTHYPIIQKQFAQCLPNNVQLINPADEIARYAEELLQTKGATCERPNLGKHEYFTTGDVKKVNKLGAQILADPNFNAIQV